MKYVADRFQVGCWSYSCLLKNDVIGRFESYLSDLFTFMLILIQRFLSHKRLIFLFQFAVLMCIFDAVKGGVLRFGLQLSPVSDILK